MAADPESGVRILGEALSYADGAEALLLEVMSSATDTRVGSDELFESVQDWPTRYHLSRLRANLLRPLLVGDGMRVLDVGAGTGALSRWLGEQGAQVVSVEGSLTRARIAAARCADLENVEVLCGSLDDLAAELVGDGDDAGESAFDLIVVCGVLEYSAAVIGGAAGPVAFLDRALSLCRPTGSVALAIENRLGLKYLLGYAEDHLGRPFAGIEGYPNGPGVQTWSRRELGSMLAAAGLGSQSWLFPFPDYKLPTLVLREEIYAEEDAVDLVDQLARLPVMDYAMPPLRLADERAAHRGFVAAGLGPDVANSFLVVASPTEGAQEERIEQDVAAWLFGDERARSWLRTTRVHGGEDRRVTQERTFADVDDTVERGWLRQVLVRDAPYHDGSTFEQLAFAAARDHDLGGVREVLVRWRGHIRSQERPAGAGLGGHPFLSEDTTTVLPSDHLDVALDNFVVGEGVHFIDREWQLAPGVDADLVVMRALWGLARRFVTTGIDHPWAETITVDGLHDVLGVLCGESYDAEARSRWFTAEGELQEIVTGQDPVDVAEELAEIGRSSRAEQTISRRLPFTRLQAVAAATAPGVVAEDGWSVGEALRRAREEEENLRSALEELQTQVAESRDEIHRMQLDQERIESELASAREVADGALADNEALRVRRDELDQTCRDLGARLEAAEGNPVLRAAKRGSALAHKGRAAARKVMDRDG